MSLGNSAGKTFERRRQRPLVLEVRDELERIILDGEIGAGERLNETELASQMGVSRGPVREAARTLAHDRLLTSVSNQGVFVRDLSIEDALELYDLRALIAGYLCARVADRARPTLNADLRRAVTEMARTIEACGEDRYFELNLAFHDRIAEAADAPRARRLYASLGKEVRLLRRRVLCGQASLRLSNQEHDRIVTAIEAGDAEAARAAGTTHHLNGKTRLTETL